MRAAVFAAAAAVSVLSAIVLKPITVANMPNAATKKNHNYPVESQLIPCKNGTNEGNGFAAKVFLDKPTKQIVISISGTDLTSIRDISNGLNMAAGNLPPQYESALALYNEVRAKYPDTPIIFTGHSLGGSICQVLAKMTGEFALTFNAFSTGMEKGKDYSNIINIINSEDFISMSDINTQPGKIYITENKSTMLDPFKQSKVEHTILFHKKNGTDVIELKYQHTYNRHKEEEIHSATTEQRPDIVLNIQKQDGFVLTYLYDAKYRVLDDKNAGDMDNVDKDYADYPPSDAINQMHRYRDAIYYGSNRNLHSAKEIIGGYILFPGRTRGEKVRERYFFKSIETVNIGAFPLLPSVDGDGDSLLKEHLTTILLYESKYEHIKNSIPQRGLYYVDTKPVLAENNNVFTVTVRKSDNDYDLFKSHSAKKYVMETLPKVNILGAQYLLPMVGGEIDSYYKINGLTIEDGKMAFKLGECIFLGNKWINIYQNMRHGELITMDNVVKLYELRI